MKFKIRSKVLAALLVVAMLLTLVPVGAFAADGESGEITFTHRGPSKHEVNITGTSDVKTIWCLQQGLAWPYVYGQESATADNVTTFVEGTINSATAVVLSEEEINAFRRIMSAGYPYNTQGYLDVMDKWEDAIWYDFAASIHKDALTEMAVWMLSAEFGLIGNDGMPTPEEYANEFVDFLGQDVCDDVAFVLKHLLDYAHNKNASVSAPTSTTISFSGDGVMVKDNDGKWKSGAIQISEPVNYNLTYNLMANDSAVSFIDENGNNVTSVKENQYFYVVTDAAEGFNGSITATATATYPSDVTYYSPTRTKPRGQGEPSVVQTMLCVDMHSMNLSGSLEVSSYKTITVNKKWDATAGTNLPAELKVTLEKEGNSAAEWETVGTVTLTAPDWTYTWDKLPADGVYRVEESAVDGYVLENKTETVEGSHETVTFTNKLNTEAIRVSRNWIENTNYSDLLTKIRPMNVEVELVKKTDNGPVSIKTAILDADNKWSAEWIVPNDPTADYEVLEVTDSPYYSKTYVENEDTGVFTITNTLKTQNVSIQKIWEGDDANGHRPSQIYVELFRETESGTGIFIEKQYLSEENDWSYKWKDLPHGKYYVVEQPLPTTDSCFYQSTVSEKSIAESLDQHFVITNTHISHATPSAIQFTVNKEWVGTPMESVQVQLYEITTAGGIGYTPYGDPVTLSDNGQTPWKYTWENLPFGQYFVEELNVAEKYISTMTSRIGNWTNHILEMFATITNTEKKISVTVEKTWAGNKTIPDSLEVVVYLMSEDGQGSLSPALQDPIVLNADNKWKVTKDDLPYGNYTVEEAVIDGYRLAEFDGYQDPDGNWTFELTNEPEAIDITITKEWTDNDSDKRPNEIKVELLYFNEQDQKLVPVDTATSPEGVVTLSKDNNWTITLTGLPHGEYEVQEIDTVEGYVLGNISETVLNNKGDLEFVLTNDYVGAEKPNEEPDKPSGGGGGGSYVPTTGTLEVTKTVAGAYGDTNKAFTFKVTLDRALNANISGVQFTNGVGTFTLKHGEHKYLGGLPADTTYTVTESDNEGYEVTMTGETGVIAVSQTATVAFINTKDSLTENSKDTPKDEEKDPQKDSKDEEKDNDTQEEDVTVPVTSDGQHGDGEDLTDLNDPNTPSGDKDAQDTVDAPQTGDNSKAMMWAMVFLAALFGLVRVNCPAYKHAKHWF